MITIKDIEKLASLARIKVNDGEKEALVKEIDSILNYVAEINSITSSMSSNDVKPRAGIVRNIIREDRVENSEGKNTEDILSESPKREGDYIAVKKIL